MNGRRGSSAVLRAPAGTDRLQRTARALLAVVLALAAASSISTGNLPAAAARATAFDCGSVAEIPQAECNALVALYNATSGVTWVNSGGWMVTTTPCSWYGVTCTAGHVTKLDLRSNQMRGTLPPDLQYLSALQYLYLTSNLLSGAIPAELGRLPNLLDLWLPANLLTGTIPPALGQIASLKTLWLDTNQLTGSIPPQLGNLSNLTYLGLRFNQLSGSIPVELGNLRNLSELWLSSNQLSGSIPPQLANLANLTILYLRQNQLSGPIPPQLGNLSKLTQLSLSINSLSGPIPLELANLAALQGLWLYDNQLTGAVPPQLGNLTNLTALELGQNSLTGSIPRELAQLTKLQSLMLHTSQLSGSIPPELGNLTQLVYLRLDGNQLDGGIPAELGNLSKLKQLVLYGNQLTGSIPAQLGNLPVLELLWLHNNRLGGAIPSELGNDRALMQLDISRNQLNGVIPSTLVNLTNLPLHINELGYNELTASDPALLSFLAGIDNDWDTTQTVTPAGLQATALDPHSVRLTWTPVRYRGDGGYYEIGLATSPGGPYTIHGASINKSSADYTASALSPNSDYYFVVRTFTPAHDIQKNALTSDFSAYVLVHTPAIPCYNLALSHSGSGSNPVAVPAKSADCAGNSQYLAGEVVNLTATPAPGWVVNRWTGTANDASKTMANSLVMPAADHMATVIYATTQDAYEVDDACSQAHPIAIGGDPQDHNFHVAGDNDWLRFDASAGTTYRVEVEARVDSPADVNLELYTDCSTAPSARFDESFTPGVRLDFLAPSTGTIYVRLKDVDPMMAGPQVAYRVSVRALQPAGAAKGALIVLAGRLRVPDHLQPNINKVAASVYALYKARGYDDQEINYLALDPSLPGYDQPATLANLQNTITVWALGKVGPGQPLMLYLADHGDIDAFFVDDVNHQRLSPDVLNAWLNQLEAAVPGLPVTVVIEACNSGSFIDGVQTISKPGRTVIASTSATNVAYASNDGAQFSDRFVTGLSQGNGMCMSFLNAADPVHHLYSLQQPWMDANGNRIPNEPADCTAADQQHGGLDQTPADTWAPYIVEAHPPAAIVDHQGVVSAVARDNQAVVRAWAVIYPPSYVLPGSGQEMVPENAPTIDLQPQGNDVYSAEYTHFDEVGHYRVAVYAQDASGLKAGPYLVTVENGRRTFLPYVSR